MDENKLNRTGIWIAHPTSPNLTSIHPSKNTKPKVNDQNAKVGKTEKSFRDRKKDYLRDFDNEVEFIPVALVDQKCLDDAEHKILSALQRSNFHNVGGPHKWFLPQIVGESPRLLPKLWMKAELNMKLCNMIGEHSLKQWPFTLDMGDAEYDRNGDSFDQLWG